MNRIRKLVLSLVLVIAMTPTVNCFADALSDWQSAQLQVMTLTTQVQQYSALAQTNPEFSQALVALQAQLDQAQQQANALFPAAVEIVQQQQAAALQAQQAAALQSQQVATASVQQNQVVVPQTADSGEIVYIASSGEGNKYHRQNCRTLKNGATAISKSQAVAMGRTACKVCHR